MLCGLEFQVLLEHKADTRTMAEMVHIEIVTETGTFGCSTHLFKEREYKVSEDWLPMSTTVKEVAELFAYYGRVTWVYKEMALQYKQFPRYWGRWGTFVVCIIPPSEQIVSANPDFRDVKFRGRTYTILSVVLGMPPRCYVCRVRGHKRKECTACRYCGSTLHTTTEHSVNNARRKGWSEVAGATRVTDFVMEEEEQEAAE